MRTTTRKQRWVTAKIAWSVATTAGMAAIVASLLPGEWAAEAFETLRFATLLYGAIGVWDFVSVRGFSREVTAAGKSPVTFDTGRLSGA